MNRKDYLILSALLLLSVDINILSEDEIVELFNGSINVEKFNEYINTNGSIPKEETKDLLKEYVDKFLYTL